MWTPLLRTTVGGELWIKPTCSVLSHQPQLLWDESKGMMGEMWREGECGASEESIPLFLSFVLKCVLRLNVFPFVLFLVVGQNHVYTCGYLFPFSVEHLLHICAAHHSPGSRVVLLVICSIWSSRAFSYKAAYFIKPSLTLYFSSISSLPITCTAFLFPPCQKVRTNLKGRERTPCSLSHFKIGPWQNATLKGLLCLFTCTSDLWSLPSGCLMSSIDEWLHGVVQTHCNRVCFCSVISIQRSSQSGCCYVGTDESN